MEKILSIVIPAYNVEKYLERCLASFEVAEILERIEVLVINDGSKDKTAAIAQRYCDKYPGSYFLYNKENGDTGPVSITESVMREENILRSWTGMTG